MSQICIFQSPTPAKKDQFTHTSWELLFDQIYYAKIDDFSTFGIFIALFQTVYLANHPRESECAQMCLIWIEIRVAGGTVPLYILKKAYEKYQTSKTIQWVVSKSTKNDNIFFCILLKDIVQWFSLHEQIKWVADTKLYVRLHVIQAGLVNDLFLWINRKSRC